VNESLHTLPRFTAEASLYSTNSRYHAHGMHQKAEHKLYLADYVDQACLNECTKNCGLECAGQSKAECIAECAGENAECETICTRPGNPPSGGGGGGGGGAAPPLISYGNYCGPGFGDPTGATPPVDAVDAVCRTHDLCYQATTYFNCGCDRALLFAMPVAIAATTSAAGVAAGAAAILHFAGAPCTCSFCLPLLPPLPFPCIPVPIPVPAGVGGIGPC
jgi:hypothetical protein